MIHLVAIGKLRERYIREGVDYYLKLIKRWCPVKEWEVDRIENFLVRDGYHVLLDERGKLFDSLSFSRWLQERLKIDIYFYIGGADGFGNEVKKKADFLLSLSPLTFPHELARLILAEQIYRALSILKGTPYHR